MTDDKSSA